MPKTTDFDLTDPALGVFLAEAEQRLRFPAFNPEIAYRLGDFLRIRFAATHDPTVGAYIQIRSFPARPSAPFVLFAAVAGNYDVVSNGSAYQVDGKARVVEHHGASSFSAKAFAAKMGWPVEKMGFFSPEHVVSGGGFPIKLQNCSSVVGAIVVSGLPDAEDHQFIIDSLEEFLPTLPK
ncbi:hypothetical protein SBRCBS47491_006605 [Sporothrix bragantina]|uniref:Heme-degrading domain-containing protein n=1 Tax=Sporothrix bragantina TaxID=671064 RepID=A0ABP0C6M4_9PEZI